MKFAKENERMELSTSYRLNRRRGESFDIFVLELDLEEACT
jgi:hypothetical protein